MLEVHTLTSAMARIQRLVARGFFHHVSGVLRLDTVERVMTKLDTAYGLSESEAASLRRLRHGEARARITLWPEPEGLAFVVTATEGIGTVHEREHLSDARDGRSRIRIRRYELVQLPRRGDVPRWTWRLDLDYFRGLSKDSARYARREHPGQAQRVIDMMAVLPGFSGVRTQKKQMYRMLRDEAKRAGRKPLQMPELIPWVRSSHRRCEALGPWLAQERVTRALAHVRAESVDA